MVLLLSFFKPKGNKVCAFPTKIVNKEECGVWHVCLSPFQKRIIYNIKGQPHDDVAEILFHKTQKLKDYAYPFNLMADFDIITSKGMIIEVHTQDVKLIEKALEMTKETDVRTDKNRKAVRMIAEMYRQGKDTE